MGKTLFTLLVTGPGGAPIADAWVQPFLQGPHFALYDGAPRGEPRFRTDAAGRVAIPPLQADAYDRRPRGRGWWRRRGGDPAAYKVVVWKEGFLPAVNQAAEVELQPAQPVMVEVEGAEGCQLEVQGRGSHERGLRNVRVWQGIHSARATLELPFVPGEPRAVVVCPAFREEVELDGPIAIEPGRAVEVELRGDFAQLERVAARCGTRTVGWRNPDRRGAPVRTVALVHVTGGPCTVTAQARGADDTLWEGQSEVEAAGPWSVELAPREPVEPGAGVVHAVWVVDEAGAPVAGARVVPMVERYPFPTHAGRIPPAIERSATTDTDGRAAVSLWPGTTFLMVLAEGFGRSDHPVGAELTLVAAPGERVPLVIDGLPEAYACRGSVLDEGLHQRTALVEGELAFWAPVGDRPREVQCMRDQAHWQAELAPGVEHLDWGRTVRVESDVAFIAVSAACTGHTVDQRSTWDLATARRVARRSVVLEGVGKGPCEVGLTLEDGSRWTTTREPDALWTLRPSQE